MILKEMCIFFVAGTKNQITNSNEEDESSFSAMYQEVLVEIELS